MNNTYVWDQVLQQRHKELMCEAKTERLVREIKANQRQVRTAKSGAAGKLHWSRALNSVKFVKLFLSL